MAASLLHSYKIRVTECEILKHLNNLPEIGVNTENDVETHDVETQNFASLQTIRTIEKIYRELSSPTHPVTIAMQKMRDIPEVRIIEGDEG